MKRSAGLVDPDKKAKKPWQVYLGGSPTLLISILLHLLLALLAAYFIVQRVETRRKQNFNEVNVKSSSNAVAQVQHQVQMTKMRDAMTTPDINERITTLAPTPINLPKIGLPSDSSALAGNAKMGATDLGGLGIGVGAGSGTGAVLTNPHVQIDTQSIAYSAFGNEDGIGLIGHFYDLKQTRQKKTFGANGMTYYRALKAFMDSGWQDGFFRDYFMASKTLSLPQLRVPPMQSEEAPKAFGVDKEVQASYWVALYKGKFQVPETGTYRFVGFADNLIKILVNHKLVFDQRLVLDDKTWQVLDEQAPVGYKYDIPNSFKNIEFTAGAWMDLQEGNANSIQLMIGDDGGSCQFWLMVEEKDHQYQTTPEGSPILPLFKLTDVQNPSPDTKCPPYDRQYMGWKTVGDDEDDASESQESAPAQTQPSHE